MSRAAARRVPPCVHPTTHPSRGAEQNRVVAPVGRSGLQSSQMCAAYLGVDRGGGRWFRGSLARARAGAPAGA